MIKKKRNWNRFTQLPDFYIKHHQTSSGWWFQPGIPTPLKNDGLCHLGWWHSQYEWKVIKFMFQTTKQWFFVTPDRKVSYHKLPLLSSHHITPVKTSSNQFIGEPPPVTSFFRHETHLLRSAPMSGPHQCPVIGRFHRNGQNHRVILEATKNVHWGNWKTKMEFDVLCFECQSTIINHSLKNEVIECNWSI